MATPASDRAADHRAPRAHVVVPTHTPRHLALCLASLGRQQTLPASVVVTVDGEVPEVEAEARDVWQRLDPARRPALAITTRPHGGVAQLNQVRNNGMRALDTLGLADNDLVIVLDGDTMLAAGAVGRHLALAAAGADLIIPFRINLTEEATARLSVDHLLGPPTVPGGSPGTPTDPGGSPGTPTVPGGAPGPPTVPGGSPGTPTVPGGSPGTPTVPGGFPLDPAALATDADRHVLAQRHRRYQRQLALKRIPGLVKPHKPKILGGHHAVRVRCLRAINGYDEAYTGYGFDDDDLTRRLHQLRPRPRAAIAAADIIAVHLWHPSRAPARPEQAPGAARFARRDLPTRAEHGWATPAPQRDGRLIVIQGA